MAVIHDSRLAVSLKGWRSKWAWQTARRRCLHILTQTFHSALPKGNGFLVLAGLHLAVVKSIRLVGGDHFMLKACFLKKV